MNHLSPEAQIDLNLCLLYLVSEWTSDPRSYDCSEGSVPISLGPVRQLKQKKVRIMTPKDKWYHWVLVVGVLCVLGAPGIAYSTGWGRPHGTDPSNRALWAEA